MEGFNFFITLGVVDTILEMEIFDGCIVGDRNKGKIAINDIVFQVPSVDYFT